MEQAEEDLRPTLSTRRLLAELGIADRLEDKLAKPIERGLWRLHGKVLTDAELDAQLADDAIVAVGRPSRSCVCAYARHSSSPNRSSGA